MIGKPPELARTPLAKLLLLLGLLAAFGVIEAIGFFLETFGRL